MSLSVGIVGLPNVGKSTLFKALTQKDVEIANYPFATIDPSVGIIEVPDSRLFELAQVSRSQNTIPGVVEVYDIAGLVKGAHKGEGLGNQFLSHIAGVDAIVYMVRAFEGEDIQHVESSVDPVRDSEIIRTELALKDRASIETYLHNAQKEARGGNKDAQKEVDLLNVWCDVLDKGNHIFQWIQANATYDDSFVVSLARAASLLTAKHGFYVVNTHNNDIPVAFQNYVQELGYECIALDAQAELESATMSDQERTELGIGESALPMFARVAYKALNRISFFTTGEKETRAWTTEYNVTAPQAAGAIHSDFQEKFIRAQVVQWNVLVECGGWNSAKTKGLVRTEGKEYRVQDGDVLLVLHGA